MDVAGGRKSGIARSEWVWVARWVLLLTLAMNLPYLVGYLLTPKGYRFLFLSTVNTADFHTYFAWAEQARQGHLFFRNLYTPEADARVVFHPLFYLVGRVAALCGLSVSTVFHAVRVVGGAGLLFFLYRLGAFLFDGLGPRRLFFWFATVTSGLGGYLTLLRVIRLEHFLSDRVPADIHIPEAFTLWSAALSPLFSLSILLMLLVACRWLLFLERGDARLLRLGFALLLLLPFVHPYDLFIIGPLIFCHALWETLRRRSLRPLLASLGLLSGLAPYVGYALFVLWKAPRLADWVEAPRLSPPIYFYLLGAFFLLLPALFAVGRPKLSRPRFSFFFIWACLSLLLAYLPLPFQRRLVEGWQLALAVLALLGLERLTGALPSLALSPVGLKRPHRLYLILSAFSLISILTTDIKVYAARVFPFHLSAAYWRAFEFLSHHAPLEGGVLSSFPIGSFIPAYTGRFVYLGHQDQSLNRPEREQRLIWFFSPRPTCQERADFMRRHRLRFLFFSPYEGELGPFNPSACPQFERVFSEGEASLFRLRGPWRSGAGRGGPGRSTSPRQNGAKSAA